MRQHERRQWRDLKARLFRPAQPRPGTEAFVRAVMARIPENPPTSFLPDVSLWFKVPALAFAALLLMVMTPSQEEPAVCTDEILLVEKAGEPMEHVLRGVGVQAEELIGFSREDL